jgi:hypothetical protein
MVNIWLSGYLVLDRSSYCPQIFPPHYSLNLMKTGLFCTYENPHQKAHQAIADQTALILHAEALGFEEAWITEHHFSDFHVSPSIRPHKYAKNAIVPLNSKV